MKQLNPAHIEAVSQNVNQCPYFTLLSMRMEGLEWGRSFLAVEAQEKHLQPYGLVHGGVLASVVDAACFWAVYAQVPDGTGMTTVELKLNYLAPVSGGKLRAEGRCIKAGKTICLGEARVEDAKGKLLAHGTSTLMVLPDLQLADQASLPPKYLEADA